MTWFNICFSMFFNNFEVKQNKDGTFTVSSAPRKVQRVLHCKRRWVGRKAEEILEKEFGIMKEIRFVEGVVNDDVFGVKNF